MAKLLDLPFALQQRRDVIIYDDFAWYVTAHLWTSVLTDSGTAAVGDAAGGVLTLTPSDGSVADNDEAYIKTTNEIFLLGDDKPLLFEARIQYTEAATNAANVAVGVADAVAANTIVDDGGGVDTSFSGAMIYKVDGSTVWKCISSLGSTQTITTSTTTAGGSAYQTLQILFQPITSTTGQVDFFVDGVQLLDSNGAKISHSITFTSATEMNAFAGVKNGTAAQQTCLVDYIAVSALR